MDVSNNKTTPKLLNDGSRSITYHSRMRYLKSRDGWSSRNLLGKRIPAGENFLASFQFTKSLNPCSTERLLPPMQLMTKEKSLRHLYRLNHPPDKVKKLDFYHKNKANRRDEIRAKLHAEELAIMQKSMKNRFLKETVKHEIPSCNEIQCEDTQEKSNVKERLSPRTQIFQSLPSTNSGMKNDGFSHTYTKTSNIHDEIHDGSTFSFLKEWKKELQKNNITSGRS